MAEHSLSTKFDAQARSFPDRKVAVFGGESLTYGELKRQSDAVARALRAGGVRPGDRVAVALFRSLRLLPGLLGVLKAGAVCVPVDPDDPAERSATILDHAEASLVLTERELRGRFARSPRPVGLIEELLEGDGLGGEPEPGLATPDGLAFLFYTSGSTGVPKGVMLSHRALAAGQSWLTETFPLGPGDAQLLRTTISITNLIREVFWPIFSGGTIVIVPPGRHKDADAMLALMAEHQVRTIMVVPALLSTMCDLPAFAACRGLKYVFCSSDVMPAAVARKYFATGAPGRLFNVYGLTEALYCTYHAVSPDDELDGFVPVGRAAELTPEVLDARLQPVGPGEVGELFIGGVGMAEGYYQRPDLTAERFVMTPRGRRFRTGDLARLGPHGLELLGRTDDQVKIAGYRVELGELEAHLDRCPGVRKAVAVGRVDVHGHKRLVAYLTSDEPASLRAEAIRAHLSGKLPEYMIPGAFAVVDAIPLTHNGKVDRSALEKSRGRVLELAEEYVPPRDPTEAFFCALWAEALGRERVGVHDNFFTLGGDSILGLLVATKAYREGYKLASTQVFSTPTVAELAAFVGAAPGVRLAGGERAAEVVVRDAAGFRPEAFAAFGWGPDDVARAAEAVARRPGGEAVVDFYPLTELQKGMWFHSLLDPASGVYFEQFVYDIDGPVDLPTYRRAWQQVVDRHDILRCSLHHDAQLGPIQVVHAAAEPEWAEHDASASGASFDAEFERFLAADRARGFRYDEAPLLRLTFFARAPGRYKMVVSYHHLILDAWSLFVMLNDSLRLYYALVRGEPARLSPARSFRHYVASMCAEDTNASRAYWRAQLAGFDRPTKVGRAEKLGLSASELEKHLEARLDLTEAETRTLLEFGRKNQLTLNTLVQGGWALLLSKYSRGEDVCFGITITHRPVELEGVENMVGIFINSLPMRVRVEPGADVVAWLHAVQREQVAARAHDYFPLPLVQRDAPVPGDEPLFETLLIFENFPRGVDWQKGNDVQVRQRRYVGWTNYPFAIEAMPEEHLFFQVKYDEAFFATEDVDRILRDYRAVLLAMAADEARTVGAARDAAGDRPGGVARAAPSAARPRGTLQLPERSTPPRTDEERELAAIWARVLRLDEPDVNTPFLKAGGDSLKGMQVLALARQAGYELELRELFTEAATIATLAARAAAAGGPSGAGARE
ncbi:MAG TPA: amino acid adenylation domain-containing protein [Polyangiaceae bacterium]|nr:amino acid adenylation domain-containing protein [Polyangiaceae bacterium]